MAMELTTSWPTYSAGSMTYRGYWTRPTRVSSPLPAILVIQEVWGPDPHIQDVADRFARAGYQAFAPDLLAPGGSRPVAFTEARVEEAKRAMESIPRDAFHDPAKRQAAMAALPAAAQETLGGLFSLAGKGSDHLGAVEAAVRFLRGDPSVKAPKVGSVGFCMGGGLSANLACSGSPPDAAVSFYGRMPDPALAPKASCPVLAFFGGEDHQLNETLPPFQAAMKKAKRPFEAHTYPNTPHAFFNDTRFSYTVAAARDAWARTLGFFALHVAPA